MSGSTILSTPAPRVDNNEPLFPIREVARQTGINPVTLRAWERRYGLIKPLRSAKGHRLYSIEHIDKIRKVLDWLERGVAVSQVKRLLEEQTLPTTTEDSPWRIQQEQWWQWIEQLAERKLDEGFKQASALYPPETLCQYLLLPLIEKLQQYGTVAEGPRVEQIFFMTWLRTQLASRIVQNNRLHNNAPLLVVSLSEQNMQPDLWLAGWLASYSEYPIRVLEWPIPSPDLALAVKQMEVRAVLLYGSHSLNLEQLHTLLNGVQCPLVLFGQAVTIHREELNEFTRLTCATDPLHAFQSLLRLNLLQNN